MQEENVSSIPFLFTDLTLKSRALGYRHVTTLEIVEKKIIRRKWQNIIKSESLLLLSWLVSKQVI